MTIFLLLIGGLAVWGVVASIVVVARDGYRRQPVRTTADDWTAAPDISRADPSDLIAGQWLPDRTDRRGRRPRSAGHPAGVMPLRPW